VTVVGARPAGPVRTPLAPIAKALLLWGGPLLLLAVGVMLALSLGAVNLGPARRPLTT
jgi:hypothetical protein